MAGYADLQESGYIDHFFVAGPFASRGVGTALMEHLHLVAQKRHILELSSDVSLTAEPFFAKYGFVVEARNSIVVRGVTMFNTRVCKQLVANRLIERPAKGRAL
jgi:putative acetyltransferase